MGALPTCPWRLNDTTLEQETDGDDLSPARVDPPLGWRERQYAALAELALVALRQTDLDMTLAFAAERLREALGSDLTKVLDAHAGARGLLVRSGAGWPEGVVGETEVPEGLESHAGYTLRIRQPVIVDDIRTEKRFASAPVLLEHGVRSGIAVVIEGDPEPFGVLQADSMDAGYFRPEDVTILQTYANVLSVAIAQHEREQLNADFAAIAAHELRNPLTLLIGYSSRLLRALDDRGVIDSSRRDEVEVLYTESLRLRRAVATFLALGDVERRSVGRPLATVDIVATVRSAIEVVSQRHPAAAIRLMPEASAMPHRTDAESVNLVVANLVENGIKYSSEDSVIRVSIVSEGATLRVSVEDRCGGLSEADSRHLFQRSYRGHNAGPGEGLGLGLYVSHRLAEQLGGTLRAENTRGGCIVSLLLPTTAVLESRSVAALDREPA